MNIVEMIFKVIDRATAPIRSIDRAIAGIKNTASVAGRASLRAGKLVATGLVAAGLGLSTVLGAATTGAIAFESAMADVNKVVDFESPAQFKTFSTDILTLSTRIPLAAKGLAEISAAAGAANIALEDNLRFTEFTAKSAVAFDMAAKAAGTYFAYIRNNYRLTQSGLEDVADAVNYLSNNMASTAPQITQFLNRAAGAAPMLKITATQMAAIGSAMIATGTAPEVAGRGITVLATNLKTGGKKINSALKMVGLNHAELMKQFDANPGEALIKLFSTIQESSEGTKALKNLVGQDFVDDFSKIVSRTDLLAESLGHVADQAKYAGSVQKEFETRAATTANSFDLLRNNIHAIGVEVGSRMLPPLAKALTQMITWLRSLRDGANRVKVTFEVVTKFFTDFGSAVSAWADPFGESLGKVGTAFSAIAGTISRIIALFTGGEAQGFGTLIGNAVAGTLDLVLRGVAIAAKAIDWLLRGLGTIIQWFQSASVDWSFLTAGIAGAWQIIKSTWSEAVSFFDNIWSAITPEIGWASTFDNAWNSAKSAWVNAPTLFADIWQSVGEGIATYVEPISTKLQSIATTFASIWDKLGQIGSKIAGLFTPSDADNINRVVSVLGTIAGFTFDTVLAGLDLLLKGIDKLLGYFSGDPVDWSSLVPAFNWETFLPSFAWAGVITTLVWSAFVTPLKWSAFTGKLPWRMLIAPVKWSAFVAKLSWRLVITPFKWLAFIPKLIWRSVIAPLKWLAHIGKFAWRSFLPRLSWSAFIPKFSWLSALPKLNWASVAGKLSWRMLITPLKWGSRLIPGIGWAVLAGELAWHLLIKPLGWAKYISPLQH